MENKNRELKTENVQLQKDLEAERNKKSEECVVRGGGTTRTVEDTEKIEALTKELLNRDNQLNQQQNALNDKDNEINRMSRSLNLMKLQKS